MVALCMMSRRIFNVAVNILEWKKLAEACSGICLWQLLRIDVPLGINEFELFSSFFYLLSSKITTHIKTSISEEANEILNLRISTKLPFKRDIYKFALAFSRIFLAVWIETPNLKRDFYQKNLNWTPKWPVFFWWLLEVEQLMPNFN